MITGTWKGAGRLNARARHRAALSVTRRIFQEIPSGRGRALLQPPRLRSMPCSVRRAPRRAPARTQEGWLSSTKQEVWLDHRSPDLLSAGNSGDVSG